MERLYRQGTGRIVGKTVRLENGEIGVVEYYDKTSKEFLISSEQFANKYNPDGIVYATRDDFEVLN